MRKIIIVLSTFVILFMVGCKQKDINDVSSEETVETQGNSEMSEENEEEVELQPFDNTGLTKADLSAYTLVTKKSNIYEMSVEELAQFTGDGAIIIGYPECYWCNRGIPVFNDVAGELVDIPFYYVPLDVPLSSREYNIVVEWWMDIEGNEDTLYTPLTLIIKDGETIDAFGGTVPFDTETQDNFNEEEYAEQYKIYKDAALLTRK